MSLRGHLAKPENMPGYHNWEFGGCAIVIWWVEVRDAVKRPIMYNTAPYNKESSSPKMSTVLCLKQHNADTFLYMSWLCLVVCSFWLHWVLIAAGGLSLVAASRGYSSLQCAGFSLRWLLLLQSMGSRHTGFSSCGTPAQ